MENLNWVDLLNKIIVFVGVPSILVAMIYIGRKFQTLDNLEKCTEIIKFNIKAVANSLAKADSINFDHSMIRDYSPLQLTNDGLQMITEAGFIDVFSDNEESFFNGINLDNPKTKYDVELGAVKALLNLFETDIMKPVKIYLYNNPKTNYKQFLWMCAVYIRDEYLKNHEEITE